MGDTTLVSWKTERCEAWHVFSFHCGCRFLFIFTFLVDLITFASGRVRGKAFSKEEKDMSFVFCLFHWGFWTISWTYEIQENLRLWLICLIGISYLWFNIWCLSKFIYHLVFIFLLDVDNQTGFNTVHKGAVCLHLTAHRGLWERLLPGNGTHLCHLQQHRLGRRKGWQFMYNLTFKVQGGWYPIYVFFQASSSPASLKNMAVSFYLFIYLFVFLWRGLG